MPVSSEQSTPAGWLSTTFAALGVRNYRILWLSTAFSMVAFMMSMTAQGVVAYHITGSNRAVGFVMFGQGIAMLAFAPFGGVLADRISKRLLLLVCQSVIGLSMLAVALLLWADLLTVPFLAISSFVMGAMFSFLGPARQAYIGELVEPGLRGNAVALSQVAMNLTRVIGPFVAGALLAVSVIGAAGTYFFMAAIFVVVVVTLSYLPPAPPRGEREQRGVFADIALGLRHVSENPRLLSLVVTFVVVTMVSFPYMTLMPAFVIDELGAGTGSVGLLYGVAAVGGLITSLAVASLADSARAPLVLVLSSVGIGLTLILTGLAPNLALAMLTMFGVGAGTSAFQTLNNALTMREADPAYYGRVMALTMLAFSANSLMSLPIGVLADAIGERRTLIAMGAASCAVIPLLGLWSARLAARRGDAAGRSAPITAG
jgi:MFS family permease